MTAQSPKERMALAEAAMAGDEKALAALGHPKTLGELNAIMRDALDAMSPAERAADLRSVERKLGQVDRTKY